MAKSRRKRFQTGREIMETFVPGYIRPGQTVETSPGTTADQLAEDLLREFHLRLSSGAKTHPERARRLSNA